ncbi:UNVERIFIED_CONTAM: hypothetical protein EX528_08640 [Xanthomonas axonopodis]
MLEKKIKVGDDASWLPRKEGELTGSGGLIEVPGTKLEGYATKYLPFIPNAISAVHSGGLDVISYNFSGCLMAAYTAQDGRRMVCHVSTGEGNDCKSAWDQIRSTSTNVLEFRPSDYIDTKGRSLAGCYGLITNDDRSLAITVVSGKDPSSRFISAITVVSGKEPNSRFISAIKKMRFWRD